jgi:hypothetical protein
MDTDLRGSEGLLNEVNGNASHTDNTQVSGGWTLSSVVDALLSAGCTVEVAVDDVRVQAWR